MPCQELFDKQSDDFKRNIIDQESLIVTIEAGNVSSWKKYLGVKGISFGIEKFGESAPYKKVYEHLNLSVEKLGIASYFKFLICSEDVSESKPSPEGFLLAIKYAGVSRDEALIFEDSDTGIEAAHRAKIKHFKVNRHFWDNIKLAL